MSVAVPVIDYVDPDARRIYLKAGVREYHAVDDIYYEMRNLRRTDESLRGWELFTEAGGNIQKTPTTFTPRYLVMRTDERNITTKIVPDVTASHSLQVNGEQISDIGTSGADLIDKSLLPPGINVDVTLQPPGAEIIRLDSALVEFSSFNNAVNIDVIDGISGTGYFNGIPIGTRQAPSNNIADAKVIADSRGFKQFTIAHSFTISIVDLSEGYKFIGDSPFVTITADTSADMTNCSLETLTIQGELDGLNVVRNCAVGQVSNISGIFEKCAFSEFTNTLSGKLELYECYSRVEGDAFATFDIGTHVMVSRDYKGSIGIANAQAGTVCSLGIESGFFNILSSCVGGELRLRGEPVGINDSSQVGCIVEDQTSSYKVNANYKANFNRRYHDKVANTITLYEEDNVTPFKVFNADDDITDIVPL